MIKIGSFKFKVKEVNGLYDGDRKLDGEIDYNRQMIFMERDNLPAFKDLTILHEAVHGLMTLGVNRELGNDETLISVLSYNLYNFLRDNGKLVKDIIDR